MKNLEKFTVYLGSSGRCRQIFKDTAAELGQKIGANGKQLVYGGMDAGLMGIVANKTLEAGGRVTGIIPKSLKDSERIHPALSQTILVPDLWERKLKMFQRADAIIGLAGGFGTIDEVLEALHWAALGSHAKPVILVNTDGYWNDFIQYINTLPDLPKEHLIIADTIDDVFDKIEVWQHPAITGEEDNLPNYEIDILEDTDAPIIYDQATVKDSYALATALGLKQLGKHNRHIGILNNNGQFDALLRWIDSAQEEKFITDKCKKLFSVATSSSSLKEKLDNQKRIEINLHEEKWGPSQTDTHIEIKETK